jgi:hypothetical protein
MASRVLLANKSPGFSQGLQGSVTGAGAWPKSQAPTLKAAESHRQIPNHFVTLKLQAQQKPDPDRSAICSAGRNREFTAARVSN